MILTIKNRIRKSKILLLLSGLMIALCLTLSSCKPCEEKEWDTLPPETQKGANTFGCYVDGELFVPRKRLPFSPIPLTAVYQEKTLYINSISVDNQYHISLLVNNPKEDEYNTLAIGYFVATPRNYGCFGFGCSDCSHVFITKFDTVNHIVSGTFEFLGRCSRNSFDELEKPIIIITGDSVVQITKGRFDIKLELNPSDL